MSARGTGKGRLGAWAAVVFAAWTAFVMYYYFAQFQPYFSALWRRLHW